MRGVPQKLRASSCHIPFKAQKKWTTDSNVQEGVRGWFMDWSIILVAAVALSGSSFGAIELANSNLFQLDLFSMGLSAHHLKEFQGKRFFSSVLFENAPQLAAQIYFLLLLGTLDEATFVALLSSTVSLVLSVVDIWSARHLVSVMKKQAKTGRDALSIELNIDTTNQNYDEVEHLKRVLLSKPNRLARAIAETLTVHTRNIEIYQLIASDPGIKVGFTVYAVDKEQSVQRMISALKREHKQLSLLVAKYWRLKTYPHISNLREGRAGNLRRGRMVPPASPSAYSPSSDSDGEAEAYSTQMFAMASAASAGSRARADTACTDAKSSTYSPEASKKLVRLSRMKTLERELRKAMDPQVQLAQLVAIEEKESASVEFEFDPDVLCASFLRMSDCNTTGVMDGIWSHNDGHVQVNSMSTVADFQVVYDEQDDKGKGAADLSTYMANMERLIYSHEGGAGAGAGEVDGKKAWVLSTENIHILLQTRHRMQSQSTGTRLVKQESINVYECECECEQEEHPRE